MFFDDVDRSYVVAQLEGAMEEPVELTVRVRRASPLLLPGDPRSGGAVSDEARRAEQLGRELAALVPRLVVTVLDDDDDDVPAFTVARPGGVGIRFLGVPG